MTGRKDILSDAFLRDLDAQGEHEAAEPRVDGLGALLETMSAEPPTAALRERVLSGALLADRFARFAESVAQLLDVNLEKAKELLARLDDPKSFSQELPGISFCWVEGGPRVQDAVRGFVRVAAGVGFPEHEHFGEESVLVLQGTYTDSVTGEVFRPGDIATMSAGSSHAFLVPADGTDLLKLAVVHKGLRAGDMRYEPR